MLVKKFLGKTLREMGFVTKQQLDDALEKQKQIAREKTLEERLQRTRLVTEARIPDDSEMIPLLGQIVSGNRPAYTYLPKTTQNFVPPKKIAAIMRAAGLTNIRYQRFMFDTIAVHVGVRPEDHR